MYKTVYINVAAGFQVFVLAVFLYLAVLSLNHIEDIGGSKRKVKSGAKGQSKMKVVSIKTADSFHFNLCFPKLISYLCFANTHNLGV